VSGLQKVLDSIGEDTTILSIEVDKATSKTARITSGRHEVQALTPKTKTKPAKARETKKATKKESKRPQHTGEGKRTIDIVLDAIKPGKATPLKIIEKYLEKKGFAAKSASPRVHELVRDRLVKRTGEGYIRIG
jgi:hypothetical protein